MSRWLDKTSNGIGTKAPRKKLKRRKYPYSKHTPFNQVPQNQHKSWLQKWTNYVSKKQLVATVRAFPIVFGKSSAEGSFWPITERIINQAIKQYFVNAKDLKPANIMYSIVYVQC